MSRPVFPGITVKRLGRRGSEIDIDSKSLRWLAIALHLPNEPALAYRGLRDLCAVEASLADVLRFAALRHGLTCRSAEKALTTII